MTKNDNFMTTLSTNDNLTTFWCVYPYILKKNEEIQEENQAQQAQEITNKIIKKYTPILVKVVKLSFFKEENDE